MPSRTLISEPVSDCTRTTTLPGRILSSAKKTNRNIRWREFSCRNLSFALTVLLLFITAFASRLPAQTDPDFVVTVNPSIVTITQGGTASLAARIAVSGLPTCEFRPARRPSGVVAQAPAGRAGAPTILLTALPTAATGTCNVELRAVA